MKKYKHWTDLATLCGWSGTKYSHFKNRVLREGQEKFPTFTPLSFEFEETKKSGTKSVEGLVFTITTHKPIVKPDPELFPEMSENQIETIEEIRNQLVSWSVNHLTIEKLIANPFQYIENKTTRDKLQQQYEKLNYLWEKMEYVVQAKDVKDEAKYFMMAVKNNYVNKNQTKERVTIEKKTAHKKQQADLATIENSIKVVRNEASNLRADVAITVLDDKPKLMEELFSIAARKYKHNEPLSELKIRFHKKGIFRYHIIQQIEEQFPKLFITINKKEAEQLKMLEDQKRAARQIKE